MILRSIKLIERRPLRLSVFLYCKIYVSILPFWTVGLSLRAQVLESMFLSIDKQRMAKRERIKESTSCYNRRVGIQYRDTGTTLAWALMGWLHMTFVWYSMLSYHTWWAEKISSRGWFVRVKIRDIHDAPPVQLDLRKMEGRRPWSSICCNVSLSTISARRNIR